MNPADPAHPLPAEKLEPEEELPPLGAGIDFTDPNSPLAPYYCQLSHVLAALVLFLILVFYTTLNVWQTDIWGHLNFGRWIVTHQQLPDHEPFSPFADQNARYINFQWLSQAGLYLVYHLGEILAGGDELERLNGGALLLLSAQVLITIARFVLLLFAFRRLSGSMPLAGAGVLVLFLLSPGHPAILRPQMLGELFFAGLLLALSRPVLSRAALVGVPLLMVLWANTHGSYPLGLVLLAGVLAGRAVEAYWSQPRGNPLRAWADPQVQRLTLVLLLSVGGIAVLNPHGPALLSYTVQLSGHPNIRGLDEWQPMAFSLAPGGHWVYFATMLLLVATQAMSPRPLSPTQVILVLSFGVWPLFQQRMMVWWVMLVPWLLLPHWAAIGARLSWNWLHARSVPSFRKTLLVGMFVVLGGLVWFSPVLQLLKKNPRPLERSLSAGTPWKLAAQLTGDGSADPLPRLKEELQAHYPEGRFTGRIFASETQGDYLIWALPADLPVLCYTHAHLFPVRHWRDCLTVKGAQPGWWEILDRHRVNLVIVEAETHPELADQLRQDPTWIVILDEAGDQAKPDPRTRQFMALRKQPLGVPTG